jgi:hypothetical protein
MIKDGDILTIDGIEMEVTHAASDGYWLKERTGGIHYYSLVFHTTDAMAKMLVDGRARMGGPAAVTGGKQICAWHDWKKYVGAREIFDYCVRCDAKRERDWRVIKDERTY